MENKIEKIMDACKSVKDKSKLQLNKRKMATGHWYYIRDTSKTPNKWYAIGTQDEQIARTVHTQLRSKIDYGPSELGTIIHLNVAKLDRETRNRSWDEVFKVAIDQGQEASTVATWQSNWNNAAFDSIRNLKLVDTIRQDLMDVYRANGIATQQTLQLAFNFAVGEGWLVNPNLVKPNDWKRFAIKAGDNYASISGEEHGKILALVEHDLANWDYKNKRMTRRSPEDMSEFSLWIQLLWELGGSNADAALLRCDNINWDINQVIYCRCKWKSTKVGSGIKERPPIRFPMTRRLMAIIKPLYNEAMKRGGGYLFPCMASKKSCNRTRIFHAYREACNIPEIKVCSDGKTRKLVIHSYRYRMAEFLEEVGYSERQSQRIMGHNSLMVHRAYAARADADIVAPDVMQAMNANKIIQMHKVA